MTDAGWPLTRAYRSRHQVLVGEHSLTVLVDIRIRGCCSRAYPSRYGMSESDPKENSWKQGAKQLHVCSASLVRSGNYSTTRVGLRVTGWDTL